MTNYNERLDEILDEVYSEGIHNIDGKRGKAAEGEAGKMYLLDKSVRILAEQATIMADGIIGAYGPVNPPTDAIAVLIGEITSQLYSQSRHF